LFVGHNPYSFFFQLESESTARKELDLVYSDQKNELRKLQTKLIVTLEERGAADKIEKLLGKIQELKVLLLLLPHCYNSFVN
jgi:hypothetical protein